MNKIRMIALAACMAATLDASAQEQEIRLFSHRGGRIIIHKTNRCAFKKTKRCVLGKINFVSCIYRICNT